MMRASSYDLLEEDQPTGAAPTIESANSRVTLELSSAVSETRCSLAEQPAINASAREDSGELYRYVSRARLKPCDTKSPCR